MACPWHTGLATLPRTRSDRNHGVLIITASNSIQYVYPPEMFTTRFRSTGVGYAAAFSRVGAAGATYLFPVTLEHLGVSSTLLIAAIFPLVGFIASLFWAPETKYSALDD